MRGLLKKGKSQVSLVDLNEVVSDARRLVANDALFRQVSVKFTPLPGLQPVLGDRIQLFQVALNLIMNGLDAVAERSPRDRWVLVRTAEADGRRRRIDGGGLGKGIAEGDLALVCCFWSRRGGHWRERNDCRTHWQCESVRQCESLRQCESVRQCESPGQTP